jgi:uncharacterized protein (DUF362 family)
MSEISRRSLLAAPFVAWPFRRAPRPVPRPELFGFDPERPVVSLTHGDNRYQAIYDSLAALDIFILPVLKTKKYVLIKPNVVSTTIQLAATHPETLRAILDWLAPRFGGPVVVAESSAETTTVGFANFKYAGVASAFKDVSLIDLNEEARSRTIQLMDGDLRAQPVRLAARLFDPDAYVICAAVMKSHDRVVATLSIKNMVMGSPLHAPLGETWWNDKPKFHAGTRQANFNMFMTAQQMRPYWGAAIIDGFEGMEGDGPTQGTPVPSRVAIASTDFLAADRVALECMGIDSSWPGYLNYCAQAGLGQYSLDKIEIWGTQPAGVRRTYRLHTNIDTQLEWKRSMPQVCKV